MPILKPRRPTAAQHTANRANSRKSTGPKTLAGKQTASRNAFKHGRRAQAATRPMWQTLADLGEDPARYRSLLRDVVNSYPPHNPLELRVCEDITRLMLKLERIQQAQEAKLVRAYQKLQNSREKHMREMERNASYDAVQADVLEAGLRRAPDSPAKFFETTACLEQLQACLQSSDFSDETELNALYGKQPTFRGAGIINAFRALAEDPEDSDLAASLHQMILEELRDVTAEGELYYREHVEISRAMRLECLAPVADPEYLQLQRQEANLDRQLERKIKLLLSMQAAAARHPARATSPESARAGDEPLGWLGGTAQPAGPPGPSAEKTPFIAFRQAWRTPTASAGNTPDLEGPSPPPLETSEARAIALRHKIDTPRRFGPTDKEEHEEMIRQIQEVYGLAPDRPSPAVKNPAFEAGSSEKETGGRQGIADEKNSAIAVSGLEPEAENSAGSPGADGPSEVGGAGARDDPT